MERAAALGHNSYSINGWQQYCPGIYDLVMEPRILDYVEDLLGPNLICTMTHYFCKMPFRINGSSRKGRFRGLREHALCPGS